MSEARLETIPVDSLVIARKVMGGSRSTLESEVRTTADMMELDLLPGMVRGERHIAVNVTEPDEYAKRKLAYPRLAAYSVVPLADSFNAALNRKKGGMNDYVSDIALGEAAVDTVDEGSFVVGFMMSDEFNERLAHERTEAIDTLLDAAGLHLTDAFRKWRNAESEDFWLPVLHISSEDPGAEETLDDFSELLTERTASLAIDFFDVQARPKIVDVPVDLLPQKPSD